MIHMGILNFALLVVVVDNLPDVFDDEKVPLRERDKDGVEISLSPRGNLPEEEKICTVSQLWLNG